MLRIPENRNDDDLRRGRLAYINLIDYEKKYDRAQSRQIAQPQGVDFMYHMVWNEELLDFYRRTYTAVFKNIFALDLTSPKSENALLAMAKGEFAGQVDEWLDKFEMYALDAYREYEVQVYQKLEIFGDDSAEVSLILRKWMNVFKVLEIGNDLHSVSFFQLKCLQLMSRQRIKDYNLVVDLIRETCPTWQERQRVFVFACMDLNREGRLVLEAARRCRFQFWDFWCRDLADKPEIERFCPVLQALYDGTEAIMHLLFDYGFQADLRPMSKNSWTEIFSRNFRWQSTLECQPEAIGHRSVLVSTIIRALQVEPLTFLWVDKEEDEEEIVPARQKRHFFQVAFRKSKVPPQDFANCLRLLWKAIPAPYIGREEFADAIETLMGSHDVCKHYSRWIYSVYEALVPECCADSRGPRPLKHLSRCAVRSLLHKSWMMPDGVGQLNLPRKLKRYLMLKR